MKKLTVYLAIVALSLAIPAHSRADTDRSPSSMPLSNSVESAGARALLERLDEIKAMDKSTLSLNEKKALRKEVRSIKKELRANNGGVYLSVGALLLVIVLLILLL